MSAEAEVSVTTGKATTADATSNWLLARPAAESVDRPSETTRATATATAGAAAAAAAAA
eukprot:CAMPEP_0182581338 /NCGR_PEP_ID=MMETSP1324-20130603/49673_1 /TAXON_ID=236786 /ORGANISM="Florenciella sp., Strain RCC1587" /LENGTH=58 /DNA_ID=CAMNT_0024797685 /DNA_START=11 /DNA_END=182 /DNA_ORIENTATION=+